MKKNILLFIALFIYTCDDDPGSQTHCDACPDGIMRDQITLQSCLDGNTTCDDAYTSSGCLNILDFMTMSNSLGIYNGTPDVYDDSLYVIYNTDYNITGFQFDIDGLDVTRINTNIPSGFTVSHSPNSNTIIGFSTSGDIIPAGCGILFTLYHTPTDFEYWNYSDFISNLVFTDDDYSNYEPSTGVYSPNSIETCFNFTASP